MPNEFSSVEMQQSTVQLDADANTQLNQDADIGQKGVRVGLPRFLGQ